MSRVGVKLHIPGSIHHVVFRQAVGESKDHTMSGGDHQLGSTGRKRQQHTRGQHDEKKGYIEAHIDVHLYIIW